MRWQSTKMERLTAVLDTRVPDELLTEGMTMDFVRHVQRLRKEHYLEMDTTAVCRLDCRAQNPVRI